LIDVDDHNLKHPVASHNRGQTRRPHLDLDDFFASLDRTSAASGVHTDTHAADAFRSLARALGEMGDSPLLLNLQQILLGEASAGEKVDGVPDGFLDTLERVPKTKLKVGDLCAICNSPFLDDPYPLVVRLPCHTAHIFDLECIAPWLKLHTTCPLDRKELVKRQSSPLPQEEDEEEGWDDTYG